MRWILSFVFILCAFYQDADAAIKVKNKSGGNDSFGGDGVVMGNAIMPKAIKAAEDTSFESLQREIAQLEEELGQKQETLEACAQKNQNFKLAGITTLGLTGAGAAGNIVMFRKQKQQQKKLDDLGNKIEEKLKKDPNSLTVEEAKKLQEKIDNTDDDCLKKYGFTKDSYDEISAKLKDKVSSTVSSIDKENLVSANDDAKDVQKAADELRKFYSAVKTCQPDKKAE